MPLLTKLREVADEPDGDARRHLLVAARRELNAVEWRLREALDLADRALAR